MTHQCMGATYHFRTNNACVPAFVENGDDGTLIMDLSTTEIQDILDVPVKVPTLWPGIEHGATVDYENLSGTYPNGTWHYPTECYAA